MSIVHAKLFSSKTSKVTLTDPAELEDLDDDLAARADLEAARAELAKSYTSHLDLELEDIEIPKPRVSQKQGVSGSQGHRVSGSQGLRISGSQGL